MTTVFPGGIDVFSTKVDRGLIYPNYLNDMQDSIVAIETMLFGGNLVFNVRGGTPATGDGVADDWAAIQERLDAANAAGEGTVFFPPGIYRVTKPLLVYSDTTLFGFGGEARIYASTDLPSTGIPVGDTPSGQSGLVYVMENAARVKILGLQFNGAYTQTTGSITGAVTNGGLVRLTLDASTLVTGDILMIYGVGGVLGANGKFTITKINATTVDLQSSSFSGAYTSGGTWVKAAAGVTSGVLVGSSTTDVEIAHCRFENHYWSGIYGLSGTSVDHQYHHNWISTCGIDGIEANVSKLSVSYNRIDNCGAATTSGAGVELGFNATHLDCEISHNIITSCYVGIASNGESSTTRKGLKVVDNEIVGWYSRGIDINKGSATAFESVAVQGNLLRAGANTAPQGIYTSGLTDYQIQNNIISDIYTSGFNTPNAIVVSGNANGIVSGNSACDGWVGIFVDNAANDTRITNNDLKGNGGAAFFNNDASVVVVKENLGYVTENSGTNDIANGTTSRVISHGLSVTPTIKDIFITFAEQGTNAYGRFWVDTITATQFTVKVTSDPGASELSFGWRVITG